MNMINFIKKDNFIKIFIIANLLALLESIIYSFLVNDNMYFFMGENDATLGTDFYWSLIFSSELKPYQSELFQDMFPYPPLSVLFCYLMQFICHDDLQQLTRGMLWSDNSRLKVYSNIYSFKMAYFIFVIVIIMFLGFILSNYIIKNKKISYFLSSILSFALIMSEGFLGALIRGNLLIVALLFTTIFVLYNDSENIIIREVSYILLAIAFNIKPYVAIFGFLLLAEKRYKDAFKTCIYALSMFSIFFIFLDGDIFKNIKDFFIVLFNYGNQGYYMIGLKSFINHLLKFVGKMLNIELYINGTWFLISELSLLSFLFFFFKKIKKWQRVMLLTLMMILLSTNYTYILAFIIIPATIFLCEEKEINFYNIVYLCSFIFLLIPIRYSSIKIIIWYNNVIIFLYFIMIYQIYKQEKVLKINSSNKVIKEKE